MATLPKTLAYEEWLSMPEVRDGIEEVVNGVPRIMPPNKVLHAKVVQKLTSLFDRQLDEETTQIFSSVFGLVIRKEPLTCRVPDLAVFLNSGMVEEDGFIHSAPELVIEVLSPSSTRAELREKLADYESIGAGEVWVVSPEARTVEVIISREGRLKTEGILNGGKLTPLRLPEASIDVEAIWPRPGK